MRLSDERISYLSHQIISTLRRDGLLSISDEQLLVQETKKVMIKFVKDEEAADQKVRTKILSIKRGVPEGSREWDVLYEQYYNEEMNKLHV